MGGFLDKSGPSNFADLQGEMDWLESNRKTTRFARFGANDFEKIPDLEQTARSKYVDFFSKLHESLSQQELRNCVGSTTMHGSWPNVHAPPWFPKGG